MESDAAQRRNKPLECRFILLGALRKFIPEVATCLPIELFSWYLGSNGPDRRHMQPLDPPGYIWYTHFDG